MEQAEFLGLRVHNDFDRIQVCRHLAESWFILGEGTKAENLVLEGLALGERHSAFSPAFSLLALLIGWYWQSGKPEKAAFFLKEAQHIEKVGMLIERRDRLVMYQFQQIQQHKTAPDPEIRRLWQEELAEIDHPSAENQLKKLRPLLALASTGGAG